MLDGQPCKLRSQQILFTTLMRSVSFAFESFLLATTHLPSNTPVTDGCVPFDMMKLHMIWIWLVNFLHLHLH